MMASGNGPASAEIDRRLGTDTGFGEARKVAVLGHPISHSLSPVLHRAAYAALGLAHWSYTAIDVTEDQLPAFIASLSDEWAGLSLTMPLKQSVIELLSSIDPVAKATSSVNTVVFGHGSSKRTLVGFNTDVYGIVTAFGEAGVGQKNDATGEAVVLGAGATAASALAALQDLGFATITVLVRSLARVGDLQEVADRLGVTIDCRLLDGWAGVAPTAEVVISTLPGGAADSLAEEIDGMGVRGTLLDVAYAQRPTLLGAAWSAAGGAYVSGERMLLHQAVEQVRLHTGQPGDVAVMDAALESVL